MRTCILLWLYLAQSFLEWDVSDESGKENQNTHFIVQKYSVENCAVYEIKWENNVQPDTPQMTIWRMRIACWISEATDTHSGYVILIDFPLQQWLHESTTMLRYKSIVFLVVIVTVRQQCVTLNVRPLTKILPSVLQLTIRMYFVCTGSSSYMSETRALCHSQSLPAHRVCCGESTTDTRTTRGNVSTRYS
jgi:hypothetical protein